MASNTYKNAYYDKLFPYVRERLLQDGRKASDSTVKTAISDMFYLERQRKDRDFLSWFESYQALTEAKKAVAELLVKANRKSSDIEYDLRWYCRLLEYFYEFLQNEKRSIIAEDSGENKNKRLIDGKYYVIDELDKDKGVLLIKDSETARFFVRKEYSTYNIDVFKRLQELKIKGLPEIYEIRESGKKLITLEEYIQGSNLLWLMEQEDCLEESEIVDITLKLCAILSRLHKQNPPLIHRDIKPSNIMMKSGNEIVLIDFNASKEYHEGNNQDTTAFGTQFFAAPEQVLQYLQSDARTDVYGIGASMSYLMTKMPAQQIIAPGKLSSGWEKCIEMDPKARYQSVDELAQDILLKWQS